MGPLTDTSINTVFQKTGSVTSLLQFFFRDIFEYEAVQKFFNSSGKLSGIKLLQLRIICM